MLSTYKKWTKIIIGLPRPILSILSFDKHKLEHVKTHNTNPINLPPLTTGINKALTAHKVSVVVFQAKPRTKSFRFAGSALATLLISSAIEGYWHPLHFHTCKQAHISSSFHTTLITKILFSLNFIPDTHKVD